MTLEPIFPPEWNIGSSELLADTRSSAIWKVTRKGDSTPLIVKHLKPAGIEELGGAHYLQWRHGIGSIKIYDLQQNLMLLEYAGAYSLKDHLDGGNDTDCIFTFGEIVKALHQPSTRPVPVALRSIEQHFSALFAKTGDKSIYTEAINLAQNLFDASLDRIPLHGDVHHENIILSDRGWLAIDPHGLIGDAEFDVANIFYNPRDRDDLCTDMERARFMAEYFATTINRSPATILSYAFIYGCLSAAWHSEDGDVEEEERTLKIARSLRQLCLASYSA